MPRAVTCWAHGCWVLCLPSGELPASFRRASVPASFRRASGELPASFRRASGEEQRLLVGGEGTSPHCPYWRPLPVLYRYRHQYRLPPIDFGSGAHGGARDTFAPVDGSSDWAQAASHEHGARFAPMGAQALVHWCAGALIEYSHGALSSRELRRAARNAGSSPPPAPLSWPHLSRDVTCAGAGRLEAIGVCARPRQVHPWHSRTIARVSWDLGTLRP